MPSISTTYTQMSELGLRINNLSYYYASHRSCVTVKRCTTEKGCGGGHQIPAHVFHHLKSDVPVVMERMKILHFAFLQRHLRTYNIFSLQNHIDHSIENDTPRSLHCSKELLLLTGTSTVVNMLLLSSPL